MIEDAVVAPAEAEGLGVGDEMDFMTRGSEFDTEFSGHNPRAAISGITGDADAHTTALRLKGFFFQ